MDKIVGSLSVKPVKVFVSLVTVWLHSKDKINTLAVLLCNYCMVIVTDLYFCNLYLDYFKCP